MRDKNAIPSDPKILFLIDYWWRWEKITLLRFLKGKVNFQVITHDRKAFDSFSKDFDTRLLDIVPLKKSLRYYSLFLLAKDLDTNNIRYRKNIKLYTTPFPRRLLFVLRHLSERMGIPRYPYTHIFDRVYRDSNEYDEVLKDTAALVVTPVQAQDKRIIYEARRRGIRVCYWVYSWDHPVKDNEFLFDADHFYVWNDFLAKDLCRRYSIPPDKVSVTGPVQFDYLVNRTPVPRDPANRYVLYACAGAVREHVDQEMTIILAIRDMLDRIDPSVELWIRPYPFRNSHDVYKRLGGRDGVKLIQFGEDENGYLIMSEAEHEEKMKQIEQAICLVNNSSTIALEASYSDTPILQATFTYPNPYPWYLQLKAYLSNDHLRTLNNPDYPNVTDNAEEFERILKDVVEGRVDTYRAYSSYLQEFAHPLDTGDYKAVFLQRLKDWIHSF